jgi:hypothetical protein
MATDPTPPVIEFTTIMLGGGFPFAMARMCGLCCALVPMTVEPIPEGKVSPDEVHQRFHDALFEAVIGAYPAEDVAEELARPRRVKRDG